MISNSCVFAGLVISMGLACRAQILVQGDSATALDKVFDATADVTPLVCALTPIRPALDFSLRYRAGFEIDLPVSQFSEVHHAAVILLRVTPEKGRPAYLLSTVKVPVSLGKGVHAHYRGAFTSGDGKYKVELLIKDDKGRTYRSQRSAETKQVGAIAASASYFHLTQSAA